MKEAERLTNDWAAINTRSPARWNVGTPSALPDKAVKFVQNGTNLKFVKGKERDNEGARSRHDLRRPQVHAPFQSVPPRTAADHGRAVRQLARPGKGLWMYFARPKNLNAALAAAPVSPGNGWPPWR